MLDQLKFVKGAVAKKDFVPALTHFCIHNGSIKGFNGNLQLCTPIAVDLDIVPNAVQFVKAIEACEETISLHVNKAGKLVVQSGMFTTFVECVQQDKFPFMEPQGKRIKLNKELLPALKILEPFIAQDASRPWACGILLRDKSAFATNNICFVEYWLGYKFPIEVNIPGTAVRELVRIGEEPQYMQIDEAHVTFHYKDGKYLTTLLKTETWPDLSALLEKENTQQDIPDHFFDTLGKLLPFIDDQNKVFFYNNKMTTSKDFDHEGSLIGFACLPEKACFNAKYLYLLKGIANSIDFSAYPKPSIFYGNSVRGAIVGIVINEG